MITIHKFALVVTDRQSLKIPGFIKVLSVVKQAEILVLYAVVNTLDEKEYRIDVGIVGTGHDVGKLDSGDWKFYKTIEHMEGRLMWHVYVRIPEVK